MSTFGTSAYLKLISLNPKPQRTELRKRLSPSDASYDFHRSLRLHANRLLAKGEGIESVLESVGRIAKLPERTSAQSGLATLLRWRISHPSKLFEVKSHIYTSPNNVFKLGFSVDFGTVIDGRRCAVHLWNTKNPPISKRLTIGALSLIKQSYPEVDNLVVLSLLDSQLFWSVEDARYTSIGHSTALRIEEVILSVEEELRLPTKDRRTPPAPPYPLV
ncbi:MULTISPECIES: hypothetical protein [unclassified Mesorhizobium]|uniref:hypothetical protein n=1 Tax=unclassified Mesorhizobium TaxID=325217 RepID=UPI0011272874|nr:MULTISPECIES: hypothetical protein [unclassified Mesorhizobium]MCA0022925.1 hypothetical protein [Mesorhizobium sp. B263B1A]TPJ98736.1 hypothetical protein FJ489_07395 [Mesorhizobium sp. B2-5-12]TPK28899.1 hypothetical protein FJ562_00785 [Mesorhizobium sp. B2-5-6]TPN35273.1 hypothetical protein FJ979_20595 [Mesorhizobium sp. B1-1-6]